MWGWGGSMHLCYECELVYVNQLLFLLLCVGLPKCMWVGEFACTSVHTRMLMKSVDQKPNGLSAETLTSVMRCQGSDQIRAGRWVQTNRSGSLAWIDAHTSTWTYTHINLWIDTVHRHANTHVCAYSHTQTQTGKRGGKVGRVSAVIRIPVWCSVPGTILFNECPKENDCACIIVYGWTFWSRQFDITHNLSFYIIYFN